MHRFDDLDSRLKEHLEILGFNTGGGYRIWCHKQGFVSGLEKSDEELRRELERKGQQDAVPKPVRRHQPAFTRGLASPL